MRKLIIALCASGLFLAGCEEKAPYINLAKEDGYVDSAYSVATPPAADPHQVLVEEFTGQSCSNCPAAHKMLDALETTYDGRLNVIGLYLYNIQQTEPPAGYKYDFRDSNATIIGNSVYGGVNQLPNGGVDRTKANNNYLQASGLWAQSISSRLSVPSPVNIAMTSNGDNTITVDLKYTAAVSKSQNLTVIIVEDSIIDKQEYPAFDPEFPSGMDEAYVFTNVYRQSVSGPTGDPILSGTKNPGMSVKRTFTFKPSAKIVNAARCRVVAFVSNNDDNEVVQSAQIRYK